MHTHDISSWNHDHAFGQDRVRIGERRSKVVIALTAVMMVAEIAAGIAFGSMALLADGLHMASHALAIGITVVAYVYARRHAFDSRFSFGTGKVNALAGFGSAVLLVCFAALMAWESSIRLVNPVAIAFDQAILVAIAGLIVNAASAVVLGHGHDHGEAHDDDDHHDHDHEHTHGHARHDDHNLRAAYLHVIADALTSVLAIFALVAGKFLGFDWLDPLMGIAGAILVARWSWGLLRDTARVLLDRQAPRAMRNQVRAAIEGSGDDARLADLHLWSIGPGIYAAALAVVASAPEAPDAYRRRLPAGLGLVHVTVEVQHCPHHESVDHGIR
ncbi:MAG: CDF family Co(II)/Ni(II) efflux transporter DmeF [Rhodospirillales bacterium]|nr:CDF family Co(II)/Ni(II) efflux transporter DmeF [Rhodospirillales bacterium]